MAMVHRYCRELAKLLQQNEFKGQVKIYHYTQATNDYVKLTNSAFLMGAYMIVMLGQSASEAW
jgi:Dual specificity protein phosphatase, N-terminal half